MHNQPNLGLCFEKRHGITINPTSGFALKSGTELQSTQLRASHGDAIFVVFQAAGTLQSTQLRALLCNAIIAVFQAAGTLQSTQTRALL